MIRHLSVKRRKIIKIIIILLSLLLLYALFVYFGRRMVTAQIASRYNEMDTFTEEDEEILREYFDIILIDGMELVYARYAGGRDPQILIWYAVKGDINDLLEANPHYVLHRKNVSITGYKLGGNGSTFESGNEYYWGEGAHYLSVYEEDDYHIATFYTEEHREGNQDIREQVFLKEEQAD